MRESRLKLFSLGIVTKTKARGTDIIEVTPIEELKLGDGLISDIKHKHKVEAVDAKGIKKVASATGRHVMYPTWIPFGHSNRISAPDVVLNETVIIFRYSDTDDYYWTTIFREPKLRRLESVLYAFCDLKDGMKAFDKDSSYWAEVSTHDKYIHVHTSKSDKEPFEYDVKIDTFKGTIDIKDDVGNIIHLNSAAQQIKLANGSGSTYDMHEGILDITIPETINMKTKTFNLDANAVNVKGGTVSATGSSITVNGSSSVSISSPATSIS